MTRRLSHKVMGSGSRSLVHAPDRQLVFDNLVGKLARMAKYYLDLEGISGMAEGWDEAIAKACKKLDIKYVVVLPTKDYGNYYWRNHSQLKRDRYGMFDLLCRGAERIVHCEDVFKQEPTMFDRYQARSHGTIAGPNYFIDGHWLHANMARNQVMVDMCDSALVYKRESSGTRDAVSRLTVAGKPWEESLFSLQEELF